ncbi:MAG: hypothetical protein HYX91_04910 [Chloroflexi bacterium]|nr:hypothetical protein [Chloroflexota bacterium]
MGVYSELFRLAAKAGSLEGHLYDREKERIEPLDNWVGNIEKMYVGLTDPVKQDIREEFGQVLRRTLANGEKALEADIKARLGRLLEAL